MAKETNEELNLTPFIGLFAMLVVLLLVTAVWNTVEVLPTNTSNSTASSEPSSPQQSDNKPKLDLSVTVLKDKIQVSVNSKPYFFEILGGEIQETPFVNYMEQLKLAYPEKKDVVLYTDNRVPYKHLVQTFDLLIGSGFPDVGVSTQ